MENKANIQYTGNSSDIRTLGIVSMVSGLVSLTLLCILPAAAILSATGLACGIIALVKIKKAGDGDRVIPIVGVVSSGLSLMASLFMFFGVFAMMSYLQNKAEDMMLEQDSLFWQMDSLNRINLEMLGEPDSTFYIDNIEAAE